MIFPASTVSRWFASLLVVFITIAIYAPGLHGDFEFDDGANILDTPAIKLTSLSRQNILDAATSGKSGPLGRSISMLSFAANYYFTQFDPFFFKLTNLLVHLLAGIGVYAFIFSLTLAIYKNEDRREVVFRARVVALTTAAVWLVHPLNVTSVLYVVQRMTSLSALFTFFALACYVHGRRKIVENQTKRGLIFIIVGLGPLTALATLSKENGALAPYLILCIELTIFRFASPNQGLKNFLFFVFALLILVPVGATFFNWDRLVSYVAGGYSNREFSLMERLLTQPHVLMFYLRLLIFPNAGLMGIYHDDFPVSSSLTQDWLTLASVAALFAFALFGVAMLRRAPAVSLGVLWFMVSHSMESSVIALEMVHEHRNYLPIVGPIFAVAIYFWREDFDVISTRTKWFFVSTIFLAFAAVTYVRSVQWSNLVDHAAIEVHNHPNSERANYQMGRMYFLLNSNTPTAELAATANEYFLRAAEISKGNIYPIIAMIQLAYKARVEPDPTWVAMAAQRLQYGRAWAPNIGALANLVECQMSQYCKLADDDIVALLGAALANPDATNGMKGAAHALLAEYYLRKLKSLELGAPHIVGAVEAEPDRVDFRLELIRLFLVVGDFTSARSELEVARKLDRWGTYGAKLETERLRLESAQRSRADADTIDGRKTVN